jgi:anti-anti-sigma factor
MESDAFHLTQAADPSGGLVLAAEGYLDDAGGAELRREVDAALASGHTRLSIDLGAVVLFNCAGARRLVELIQELNQRHGRVDLVGVHPPLQKVLGFTH